MRKLFKHTLLSISFTIVSLLLIVSMFTVWALYTTDGARLVYKFWRKSQPIPFDLHVGQWEGNLVHGLSLKNVELTRFGFLPSATYIRIQQIDMTFKGIRLTDAYGKFTNARILLPGNDPLVVQASLDQGILLANIFARTLDIGELVKYLPIELEVPRVSGFVSQLDIVIKGNLEKMAIDGRLLVDHIQYQTTVVSDGPGEVHVVISPSSIYPGFLLNGEVQMIEGKIQARHILLDLVQSKVFFKGDPQNPQLDIHASSKIDKVMVDVGLKGFAKNPELVLSSDPPLPSEVLLIMLATGKSFGGSSGMTGAGTISGEIVSGFIDYSLLGGQGGSFAQRYGLTDFNVQYDNDSRKIGLKKKITEDMRIGVEIEQMPYALNQSTEYSKKIEGEVDLSEHLSVNVSQKVLPREDKNQNIAGGVQADSSKGESQIYLKYKKTF